jgi:hypothetical protein
METKKDIQKVEVTNKGEGDVSNTIFTILSVFCFLIGIIAAMFGGYGFFFAAIYFILLTK